LENCFIKNLKENSIEINYKILTPRRKIHIESRFWGRVFGKGIELESKFRWTFEMNWSMMLEISLEELANDQEKCLEILFKKI